MRARLTVIAGPMFSGKSSELLRRIHRLVHAITAGAHITILAFKPEFDTLYGPYIATKQVSEDGESVVLDKWPALYVSKAEQVVVAVQEAFADPETEKVVLFLDEGQFFESWIFSMLRQLLHDYADRDFEVIVAGLDLDAERHPFGQMPNIMSLADSIIKLTGVCFICGHEKASLTKRLSAVGSRKTMQLGDSDIYQARCRVCHQQA